MTSKAKNLSVLIDKQLPNFISTEYPKFSDFLQKYYEQLELPGHPIDLITNLTKYRDIDTYNLNSLSDSTILHSFEETKDGNNVITEVRIVVEDGSSFPSKNGYILIDDEVIFYKYKEGSNVFRECYRNVSETTRLGDLYEKSYFRSVPYNEVNSYGTGSTSLGSLPPAGTTVFNVSNLFLYALVKNFEKEYLGAFPENALKKDVNKNLLIKNIKQFYATKGTDQSIRFIFNSVISKDPTDVPTVYYPKDSVYKSSNGDWIKNYSLKVKYISGDITKLLGRKIAEVGVDDIEIASAIVDNVIDLGDYFYELILAEESVVGQFTVCSKTRLSKILLSTDSVANVESTVGWRDQIGSILIGSEEIKYRSKNVRQFVIDSRSTGSPIYPVGTDVYENRIITVLGESQPIKFLVFGILYNLNPDTSFPFSKEGDIIQISSSGNDPVDRIVYDYQNNRLRWIINQNNQSPTAANPLIQSGLVNSLTNVSAIFEDSEFFYITSSGYPSHSVGKSSWSILLSDQSNLKLIRKSPAKTTEIYPINTSDTGILVNGVPVRSYKDTDDNLVVFGEITEIKVTNSGNNYAKPPFVLVQDGSGNFVATAKAVMNGEKVESIEVLNSGSGFFPPVPTVTITSGRNAVVEPVVTRDKITELKIINPGEFYSSPPEIIIKDSTGSGRFAKFESIIDDDGKLVGFKKLDEGKFYTQQNTTVIVQPVGSGATAISNVRSWRKNLLNKHQSELDDNYGFYFLNQDLPLGYGYGYLANPKSLRISLGDSLTLQGTEAPSPTHSPILGYAYDGNPIYGPYGYSVANNKNSSIARMTSSYVLNSSRVGGPSVLDYSLGSFIEDFTYIHRSGTLDENNGRFCVTPEYPEGTYAYFITVDQNSNPVFPYIIGKNYYCIPVDSNYTKSLSQKDLPVNVFRVKTESILENGNQVFSKIKSVSTGSVDGVYVEDSIDNFSVGCSLETKYPENSDYKGILAKVSEVKGKNVLLIESKKSLQVISENNAYFFNGDIITQSSTNATGEVVGNVFDSKNIVLRNITGSFNSVNTLSSTIKVVSLLVDTSSTYTLDSEIILTNGKQQGITRIISNTLYVGINPFKNGETISFSSSVYGLNTNTLYYVKNAQSTSFQVSLTLNGATVSLSDTNVGGVIASGEYARGIILESTSFSNTVKIKVSRGNFVVDSEYYLRSLTLGDTVGSKIVTVFNLSSGIKPVSINNKISIVKTASDHNLAINDIVNIDINPSDATTETTYYVRSRIYQKVRLNVPSNKKTIDDTGIGKIFVLNNGSYYNGGNLTGDYAYSTSGNNTFQNVELLFADISKCRDAQGRIVGNSSSAVIGKPGNTNNAKATVTVTNGVVTNVVITYKGEGYKKGDILTASSTSLNRLPSSTNTRFLLLDVDHVGLGDDQTRLFLNNVTNLSTNEYLTIGSEIVKISSVNVNNSYVDIIRSQFNTESQNHFNLQEVSTYSAKYDLPVGYQLGNNNSDPIVESYNPTTQELLLVYNAGQTKITINDLSAGDSFLDNSVPKKLVQIQDSLESPTYKFEFSTDNVTWSRNPLLKIQKYYKYKFDTSNSTLRGSHLEFSPSKNYNIITTESFRNNILPGESGSFTTIKFGFGDNISSNLYDVKKTIYYNTFFYFDKNNIIDSDGSYIQLIEDPLQGTKKVTYVTNDRFAYEMESYPLYDGSGVMSYTTSSSTAIGKISKIDVLNGGSGFSTIPSIIGVVPSPENECVASILWDDDNDTIISARIISFGKNYVNPKAVVLSNSGKGAEFEVYTESDGSISGIVIKNKGYGYTSKPDIKIVESQSLLYYTSKDIGIPKSVEIVSNGKDFNNDFSTRKLFKGNTILSLKNITGDFVDGEIVEQYDGNILIAKAKVSPYGWNKNTNVLRIFEVYGIFKENLPIIGLTKNGRAKVLKVFCSLFNSTIKSYYDNLGYYASEKGRLSSNYQKLADNYFYQDYSYVIKSKTPLLAWKDIVKDTIHPAGFKVFGDLTIESSGVSRLPDGKTKISHISSIQLWDPAKNKITVQNTSRKITKGLVSFSDSNVERGRGSVIALSYDTGETSSYEFRLIPDFNGYFDENGNRAGNKVFTIVLTSTGKEYSVQKAENIVMTLDGIIQIPGKSFTVSGNQLTFTEAPLGYRDIDGNSISKINYKEGVDTPSQKIFGRIIRFKDTALNNQYFRQIKDISSQFDGSKTSFQLYYNDNTPVVLPSNENLFVYIDGVLQRAGVTPTLPIDRAYYIRRTVVPNEIIFMEAPIPGRVFHANSVGGYERLSIDYNLVDDTRYGPFPIKSLYFERNISIDDDKNIFVYIDGILQRPRKNYSVSNSSITFTEGIKKGKKVDILYLYGREILKSVLAFNAESQPFLNRYKIIINGEITRLDVGFRAISNSSEGYVRRVAYTYNTSRQVVQTMVVVDTQNIQFTTTENITFKYENISITVPFANIISVTPFDKNEDFQDIVKRSRPDVLSGLNVDYSYKNSLNPGDFIKIDGEDEYREIKVIPENGIKTDYRSSDDVNSSYYSKVNVTSYNYSQRGTGLDVTANIENGKVSSLSWNKIEWGQVIPTESLPSAPGSGYEKSTFLEFVSQPVRDDNGEIIAPAQGGGAKGYVVSQNGNIVDIVLYEQGSGYLTPPKVYVTRGYDVLRKKKFVNTNVVKLSLQPQILASESLRSSSIIDIIRPLSLQVVAVITSAQTGDTFKIDDFNKLIIQKDIDTSDTKSYTSISSIIKAGATITSTNIIYSYNIYRSINLETQNTIISSSRELKSSINTGSIDAYNLGITDRYNQNILGHRLSSFTDGFRFMDVGYANVSQYTIGEFSQSYPDVIIDDLNTELNTLKVGSNKQNWNVGYPSIQEYGAIMDSPITQTSTTIYIPNTSRFPSSGFLLIGDEIVRYSSKLSDRFINVARGQAGTTAKAWNAGQYLRTLVLDRTTQYSWNASGSLFTFNQSNVNWVDL